MKLSETPLRGCFVVELDAVQDERGYFARSFCREEFENAGLDPNVAQCSVSHNVRRGTLRGLHYQSDPDDESKLVRCTRGAMFDVVVDLRDEMPTYRHWYAIELTESNGLSLYIPPGIAHGFQTLVDQTDVHYQMSVPYRASGARGVRYSDPSIGIEWPIGDPVLSERDRGLPLLDG